jgi:fructose-1-phosphate kinase PfkB-like protein
MLQLVDPKEIVDAFMTKWVVCVLEASDSNMKSLLNYQLIVVKPNKLFRWEKTLNGL